MSLNPPLNEVGEPFRIEGEHFVMQRKGIEFEIKVEGLGKFKGQGLLVLTTSRLVLINLKGFQKSDFKAFDVPHALTFKEKFNQPIFGANYWSGTTKPLMNSLPNDAEFKIWFMEGGCGKFNKVYRHTLSEIRKNSGNRAGMQSLIQEFQSSAFQQQFAYFDPNDPSTIYISQPPVSQPTVLNPAAGVQQQPGFQYNSQNPQHWSQEETKEQYQPLPSTHQPVVIQPHMQGYGQQLVSASNQLDGMREQQEQQRILQQQQQQYQLHQQQNHPQPYQQNYGYNYQQQPPQ
eukprot:403357686